MARTHRDASSASAPAVMPAAAATTTVGVDELVERLDGLLEQTEEMGGEEGEVARAVVAALAELYGEALARVLALLVPDAGAKHRLAADELVGHLMSLHGLGGSAPVPAPPPVAAEPATAFIPLEALNRVRPR